MPEMAGLEGETAAAPAAAAAAAAAGGGGGGEVWFVHPDLGIGGAEMLVVNAAVALLMDHARNVQIFTAHHDPQRCFAETTGDGPLAGRVHVHGNWLPRTLGGRFHVVCAVVRMIWLSLVIGFRVLLGLLPRPAVIFCDQVSHVVPLLRMLTGAQVVFYCHFPDKLLCVDRGNALKRIYRAPMDWWEERSTGASDAVVVNSKFTASVFRESFQSLANVDLAVLYPAIDMREFDRKLDGAQRDAARGGFPSELRDHLAACKQEGGKNGIVILSINRFERKKNLGLALEAMSHVRKAVDAETFARTHLVLAGGYDPRLEENVAYVEELRRRVETLELQEKVSFLLSFSNDQRLELMHMARCVLYTPDREHFGIVPIEAMYAGCPVVAIASGGPLETVRDGETGFLTAQEPAAFGGAVARLIKDEELASRLGKQGQAWVAETFSLSAFGSQLDEILRRHQAGVSGRLPMLVITTLSVLVVALSLAIFGGF